MSKSKIKNSIVKYLYNEATSEDLDSLSHWFTDEEHQKVFEDYVEAHYKITMAMNKPDVDKIKKNLLTKIEQEKKRKRLRLVFKSLKYAAVGVLFMGIGYWIDNNNAVEDKVVKSLVPEIENVTLMSDDGTIKVSNLEKQSVIKTVDGQVVVVKNGKQLVHEKSNSDELVYNKIHVPHGKRFELILSDGSRIHLNSGTTLKYPKNFIKGMNREVFLKGEAFFEVAEDKAHPFEVNMKGLSVQVLGTEFNVSNYESNAEIQTVLVEGSVSLKPMIDSTVDTTVLEPGSMGEWNKDSNELKIEKVDTYVYTSWLQDKLIFRNTPFKKIREALERKYNVTIINLNGKLDEQRYDATFDIESIDEILESFSKSFNINYRIIDNEVIIN